MKTITTLFTLIICLFSTSQNSEKKEILYDENGDIIDMTRFNERIKDRKYTYRLYDADTAYIGKILLIEKIGNITSDDRLSLVTYLRRITKSEIDTTQNIVINFFFKPENGSYGSCINHYTADRKYKRYFKRNEKDVQFFITQKDFKYKELFVFEDKDDFIRQFLFPYYSNCGNYIIIKRNGAYLRRLGEYRQDEIPKKLNANWELP